MIKYVPLHWRPYSESGVVVHLDVQFVHHIGSRFFLQGRGVIPLQLNENVDQCSSPINFDRYCMMSIQVPKKLSQFLEELFGERWQREVLGKHLSIHCLGHSSPTRVYEKSRGTGGHYMFDVEVLK